MKTITMSASGLRVIAAQAAEIKQAVHAVKHLTTDAFMANNLIEILTSASDILATIMEEVPAIDRRAAGVLVDFATDETLSCVNSRRLMLAAAVEEADRKRLDAAYVSRKEAIVHSVPAEVASLRDSTSPSARQEPPPTQGEPPELPAWVPAEEQINHFWDLEVKYDASGGAA